MRQGSGKLSHSYDLRNLPQFHGQPANLGFNPLSFQRVSEYLRDQFQTLNISMRPRFLQEESAEQNRANHNSGNPQRNRNVRFVSIMTEAVSILGGFRRHFLETRDHHNLAGEYLVCEPRIRPVVDRRPASLWRRQTLSGPLVGRVNESVCGIYLHDGAAIDIHRKDDQLEPSLYFDVDLFGSDPDESGGQISQELLEVHQAGISSEFSGRSGCCRRSAVFLSGITSHTAWLRGPTHKTVEAPKQVLVVPFLYSR